MFITSINIPRNISTCLFSTFPFHNLQWNFKCYLKTIERGTYKLATHFGQEVHVWNKSIVNQSLFLTQKQMSQIRHKFKIQKVDKMEEKRQRNSYLSFRVT
jgi:hypothetical protein